MFTMNFCGMRIKTETFSSKESRKEFSSEDILDINKRGKEVLALVHEGHLVFPLARTSEEEGNSRPREITRLYSST